MISRPRRIFTYQIGGGTVSVDVVGSILSIVFQDEDCSVVPVRAVGYCFHYTTYGQIIVSHRSCRARHTYSSSMGMIIGQVKQNELRQFNSLTFLSGTDET